MADAATCAGGPQIAFVRILGPVQIVMTDGTTRDPPSASQRRLLALLASDAGQPIRSERLADQLDMSHGSLRTSVSRLRKLTGDEVLRTDAVGYRLDADVDGQLFHRALTRTDGGADRVAQLEAALDWWKGPALEEFREEPWARSESARLTELHAAAVEEHAGELVARRQWPQAIAALERHIAPSLT